MKQHRSRRILIWLAIVIGIVGPGVILVYAWPPFYNMGSQEFIVVTVKDQPALHADVLINGEKNGTTGELITLGSPGWVFISVNLPNAQPQNVNVRKTTATHPMSIEIECK
jgi:hypothetical protein